LLLIKQIDISVYNIRDHMRIRSGRLENTIGIITEVEKYSDIFEKDSTENDNGYIWYSQVDGKEYYFCENELTGEVVE
jgi:hypothetical protein